MKYLAFILILSLFGCANIQTEQYTSAPKIEDILYSSEYLDFVSAIGLVDGGSLIYSFLNDNGDIIHLFEDNSMRSRENDDYRRYFIQRNYTDKAAVEIIPGSELEKKIIELLTNYQGINEPFPGPRYSQKSSCEQFATRMMDRKNRER